MNEVKPGPRGMSPATAAAFEVAIIGLGVVALLLIFQPFSLALFGVGCGLVVAAGLLNNLLPLCAPGVPVATLLKVTLLIAAIFLIVMGFAIGSAYLYGVFFVKGPAG
ncbi:MAG: hypothetical protein M3N38_02450 [Pseudomonadota bacterium]|nr:hypothetical protein [Pseudomonadota bacterium]